jgi:shikimate dehydrogenase
MLINVTPVGMDGGPEAGQLAFEPRSSAADIVFDVVAIPSETPLIVRGGEEGDHRAGSDCDPGAGAVCAVHGVRPSEEQFAAAVNFARS